MVIYQGRSKHLSTGAKYHPNAKKIKMRQGRDPINTKVGASRKKIVRTRGANIKIKAYSLDKINVIDQKTKKAKIAKIKRVVDNPASVDLARRGVITQGAILDTDLGSVKVTSRPGQMGGLNGIILEK